MRANHGRIVMVVDRSGSMKPIVAATVDGYNEFINGQKAVPGTADVLLVRFDNQYEVVYDKPLDQVTPLTADDIKPRATTALRDAMGKTIRRVGEDLARLPEAERPDSVTFVTMTDGLENSSLEFSDEDIASMVKHQSEVYNWKFVFLGANQDAVLTASGFNIPKGQALSYAANAQSVGSTFTALNSYTVSNRAGTRMMSFSDQDRAAAMQPDVPQQMPVKGAAKEKEKV